MNSEKIRDPTDLRDPELIENDLGLDKASSATDPKRKPSIKNKFQSWISKQKSHQFEKTQYRIEVVKKLTGTTLQMYFYMLNQSKTGVRDAQKSLGLSSPSVSKYHLDKLNDLNLVVNDRGTYHLSEKADLPILTNWVLIGQSLIPKSLFFALLTTLLFLGYLVFIFRFWNRDSSYMIFFAIIVLIYAWNTVKYQYRRKPF